MTSASPKARGAAGKARSSAERAADSRSLEWLARAGLVGYGITHLLIAYLALRIAFGKSAGETDQAGAFAVLQQNAAGKVLLWIIVVALFGLALWQLTEAILGHTEESEGSDRVKARVMSGVRTVIYAALAVTALKTAVSGKQSKASNQESLTKKVMEASGGRFLVGLVGLIIIGVAVGFAYQGIKGKYRKFIQGAPQWVDTSGKVGYIAKAAAYGVLGVLVLLAAIQFDPDKSRGLDAALRTLAAQPFGRILLTIVALGIAAYGVFAIAQAKYRKV